MGGSEREIRLRSSAHTNIGQVRENNEDNVRLWTDDEFVVAVVADGMGGAVAGEEASRIAVDAIRESETIDTPGIQPKDMDDDGIVRWLCDTIRSANTNIVQRASTNPELRGMGTTMTLAYVRSNRAIIAHVGDSRAYLVDGHTRRITQITADHSFVEALVAAGHLTHEQAEEHPMRNVLYRALGQNEDVDVDVYETILRSGDRLVLCSDGLTRHVKAHEIAAITMDEEDPDLAGEALIDLANSRGGEDNVSVIIIMLYEHDPGEESTLELKKLIVNPDDSTLLLRDNHSREHHAPLETLEVDISDEAEDTLKFNTADLITYQNAAPDSEGHDNRAPDQ
jgi:PPM family protein phosphatase